MIDNRHLTPHLITISRSPIQYAIHALYNVKAGKEFNGEPIVCARRFWRDVRGNCAIQHFGKSEPVFSGTLLHAAMQHKVKPQD